MQKVFKILVYILFFSPICSTAQETQGDYKKEPLWIQMMNNPNSNYYQTVKAFREFWKDKVLPKEPFENEGSEEFEKEVGLEVETESKQAREREEKHKEETKINYAAEVRAFKGWMQDAKLWLRSDGSIIGAEERQNLINQQQKELKEIEQKNGKK